MSVRAAFRDQAAHCAGMGSPFTARLCTLIADRLEPGTPVADRVLDWPGDARTGGDSLPLRLAGALHGLVIEERDTGLAAVYPPCDADDAALWEAVSAALAGHAGWILARLDGPPQTNETQRSAALCPGMLTVAALTGLPLTTSELGASAGLNLCWDRFAYRFGAAAWGDPASAVRIEPDWQGPPPPLPAARVAERAGVDRAPPDLSSAADRLRLRSFVWADQTARKARMAAAIAIAEAGGIRVERADAVDWLATRLAEPRPGPRPRRLPLDLLAVPVARGTGARPGAPRRCGCAGDQRRPARLAPDGARRARPRRRDQPHALARRHDAGARPRRLSRRLGPVARLGGRADGRLIIRIPADRFAGCERWPRRRLPRHGLRLPGLAHLAVRPPRAGVG